MKSEKAKQFIDNGVIQMHNGDRMVDASTAYTALDLAEQEAEERMRAKAIKAFCDECACFEACICCLPAGACDRKNNFIQKLTE
jgi:hypothetical protein